MKLSLIKATILHGLLAATLGLATTAFADDVMLGTGGYARQLQKMEMMKMLDGDGNHTVTSVEADSYYGSVFEALDKNKDNTLSTKEWAGPTKNSKLDLTTGGYSRELRNMKMMKMMDADGDHQVTREEFLNHHQAVFAKLDTSSDQQLDAQEWAMKGLISK